MNTKIKTGISLILLSTHLFAWHAGSAGYFTEKPKPCISNFLDDHPIYDILQEEMNDVDDDPVKKQFHDAAEIALGDDIFTTSFGTKYVVPSFCKVEYNGFSVTLWRKTHKELRAELYNRVDE